MKRIFVTQWFDCKNSERNKELVECMNHNLSLPFDEVIIFNDNLSPQFFGEKIANFEMSGRLTYRDFLKIVSDPKNYGSMIVFSNTDIKLDDKLFTIDDILQNKMLFCLSRYEADGKLADNPYWTQDTWIVMAQAIPNSILYNSDIPIGTPGCELRFAEIMFNAGFSVFNPCLDLKNFHVHSNPVAHRNEDRNYGAYLFTPACTLDDVKVRNVKVIPTAAYFTVYSNRFFRIVPG